MKQKMLYTILGVLALILVAVAVDAQAQRGRRGPTGPQGMAALDLTDAQKQKMRDLNTKHQKAMIDLRATQQKAQIDLRELRDQDNPKPADIKTRVKALMDAQGQILEQQIQHGLAIKNILTPEQQKKMGEMHKNRGERRGFRNQQGFRGRGGPPFRGRGFRDHKGPHPHPGILDTPAETESETRM